MSEQETRGANEAIDFNDELRNRREKLGGTTSARCGVSQ